VLLHRGLSPVAVMDDTVVVGDFQGYLHWLDKASGALAARVGTGGGRISTQPLVIGDILVAVTDRGQINAYRVKPLAVAATRKPAAQ
jgi:outer membrane protein assembly factor BamB